MGSGLSALDMEKRYIQIMRSRNDNAGDVIQSAFLVHRSSADEQHLFVRILISGAQHHEPHIQQQLSVCRILIVLCHESLSEMISAVLRCFGNDLRAVFFIGSEDIDLIIRCADRQKLAAHIAVIRRQGHIIEIDAVIQNRNAVLIFQ